MADDKSSASIPFDLDRLKDLIHLMEEHDLSEVDLHNGDQRCRLRRGPQGIAPVYAAPSYAPAAPAPAGSVGGAPAAAAASAAGVAIKSPTIGTFYAAASPDDPPYVKVGSSVKPETVVCQVEAMKVFNQITADCTGVILEVCVANGDAVEFGQVLFRVQPS